MHVEEKESSFIIKVLLRLVYAAAATVIKVLSTKR